MSDPLRTDGPRGAAASEADHDAKIEQLLLAGLDHYFAAQYDHAINVWTRVLFLDRSHARARAYIERARSALAERQRESEELLQSGLAAFQRGDGGEARRLVQAAIESGAPTDEALSLLDRLDRLGASPAADPPARSRPSRPAVAQSEAKSPAARFGLTVAFMFVLVLAGAGVYSAVTWGSFNWRAPFPLHASSPPAAASSTTRDGLSVPRRGELALARAHALAASGRLRDALTTLDLVRTTDPEKAEADRLRGAIQRQLLALASVPAPAASGREGSDAREERPVP